MGSGTDAPTSLPTAIPIGKDPGLTIPTATDNEPMTTPSFRDPRRSHGTVARRRSIAVPSGWDAARVARTSIDGGQEAPGCLRTVRYGGPVARHGHALASQSRRSESDSPHLRAVASRRLSHSVSSTRRRRNGLHRKQCTARRPCRRRCPGLPQRRRCRSSSRRRCQDRTEGSPGRPHRPTTARRSARSNRRRNRRRRRCRRDGRRACRRTRTTRALDPAQRPEEVHRSCSSPRSWTDRTGAEAERRRCLPARECSAAFRRRGTRPAHNRCRRCPSRRSTSWWRVQQVTGRQSPTPRLASEPWVDRRQGRRWQSRGGLLERAIQS